METDADDFEKELLNIFDLERQRRLDTNESQNIRSKVLSFFGGKGGTGKTTLAVNAATQISKLGKRTMLIDLDLQFGDVTMALDLNPRNTIVELVQDRAGITIEKSYNSRSIEINYENTWKDGKIGLPLFTMEDITAGTNLICSTLNAMGIRPSGANDGLISVSPDLGTSDAEGNLIPERARLAVRGLVRTLEIIAHHAEFI